MSCADSRVAPELVFDQLPGDLFVVRVAGNYLSGDSLASLEYAVGVLKVPLIMVLGHTECGAIKATISEMKESAPLPGHIWDIVDAVRPGIARTVEAGGDNVLLNAIGAAACRFRSREEWPRQSGGCGVPARHGQGADASGMMLQPDAHGYGYKPSSLSDG